VPRPSKHRFTVQEIEDFKRDLRAASDDAKREAMNDGDDAFFDHRRSMVHYLESRDQRRPQRR
jgi:hypothetical protein